MQLIFGIIVWAAVSAAVPPAPQAAEKVDFRRDIQPIFKQSCIGCHGPSQQMNGFRLDRRSAAMRGGTFVMIVPGNSALSRLYLRVAGSQFGMQMPPTGPLTPEQIATVKAWIDQGAEWPDDLSGDAPPEPPDPRTTRLLDALRAGDRAALGKALREDAAAAKLKGAGGVTPLMYAALYGEAEDVRQVLAAGADPNVKNEVGATALMWAVDDLEKTRALVERGADVNAKSENGRTPLLIAAARFGSSRILQLLLDRGADPKAKMAGLFGDTTPLSEAAKAGDPEAMRLLLARGADARTAGFLPLYFSLRSECAACTDLVLGSADTPTLSQAALFLAPPFGDGSATKLLVERGADLNAKDFGGRNALMLAAASDRLPLDTIETILARGCDIQARTPAGQTALDFAKQRGDTAVVARLVKAGCKPGVSAPASAPVPQPAASPRAAVERIVPLLQKADSIFFQKSGCLSCHNNTLTAMTVAAARKKGLAVDEEIARKQAKIAATYLDHWRDRVLQAIGIPGDSDTVSYILLGTAAENQPPDASTDAMAYFLRRQQMTDGRWRILAHRPPIESSDIQVTAASMRALQLYAPKARRAEYDRAVKRAASWLEGAKVGSLEERAFRLLGLAWGGASGEAIRKAAADLVAQQRPDGGWSQIPSLSSDAYATGQALYALKESGAAKPADPVYARGVAYLLKTQLADGSWFVKSRAIGFQPFFESGFPHGHDQWISAAASNWAALALLGAM
jgi:ankyrin repeat protein/mono/diheme cytochrome c family protein